ncbi:hypothetical protein TcWFU_010498 [Taenia crassiceps]|uniref:Uncharacterized protein n=1 Tax=Taenia crassiceps TaxID=6207 RepID=A0ABR4QES3_9CEST
MRLTCDVVEVISSPLSLPPPILWLHAPQSERRIRTTALFCPERWLYHHPSRTSCRLLLECSPPDASTSNASLLHFSVSLSVIPFPVPTVNQMNMPSRYPVTDAGQHDQLDCQVFYNQRNYRKQSTIKYTPAKQ